MYRQKTLVDVHNSNDIQIDKIDGTFKNNQIASGSQIQVQVQQQPIYFDELSLSKFIEEYLDYQIEYAYSELGKISDSRTGDTLQHSNTANNLRSSYRGSDKEDEENKQKNDQKIIKKPVVDRISAPIPT